jgi:hypothetical protein
MLSPFWLTVLLFGGLIVGRTFGWGFSKIFLYPFPTWLAYSFCVLWAIGFAILAHLLIVVQHPGWVLKIIIFGEGWYLAIANYGLIRDDTVPQEFQRKHYLLTLIPTPVYIIAFLALTYLPLGKT